MEQKTISIIAPIYNESENISDFYKEVSDVIKDINYKFKIIFINDGSSDNSLACLMKIKEYDDKVSIIDFTRNFGKQAALTAGINYSNSDAIITIDTDLQEPPRIIHDLINEWEKGSELIHAIKNDRKEDSFGKRISTYLFYKSVNLFSNINVPENSGDFKLIDKKGVEMIKKFPEKTRWISGISNWLGLTASEVYFSRPSRKTGKAMGPIKLLRLGLDAFFSFSNVPLKIALYTGIIFAVASFIYAIKIIINAFFYDVAVQGYASIMTGIIFLGGVQLIVLGIIGEYISRIFIEVKNRPIYLVSKIYD